MTVTQRPDLDEFALRRDPAPAAGRSPRSSALFYCLLVVLLPLLAIPPSIRLGRSDFFLHHGASVWVQANDQVFTMRDQNCEVLIFGDSTAMTGIDPTQVEALTGLHTCNIAVTNAVLAVTGNLTLEQFLAHNARPRILLVQLSPEEFLPAMRNWQQTIYPEGLIELLRHGGPSAAREALRQHPQESIAFGGYAVGYTAWYGLRNAWFAATHERPAEDEIVIRNGFFTPPAPARTRCLPADAVPLLSTQTAAGDPDRNFAGTVVDAYRNRLAARAGTVLVNVAPIPDCDENLPAFRERLDGITSNELLPLPVTLFNDSRHFTARGSATVSELVADELNTAAAADPTLSTRRPTLQETASLHRAHPRRNAHRALRRRSTGGQAGRLPVPGLIGTFPAVTKWRATEPIS